MCVVGIKASCVRGVRRGCVVVLIVVSMCELRLWVEMRSDDLRMDAVGLLVRECVGCRIEGCSFVFLCLFVL